MCDKPLRAETVAAQAGGAIDSENGAVVPPLDMATTYVRDENYELRSANDYLRRGNQTIEQVENVVDRLEGGAGCLAFASGMAAIAAVIESLKPGAHVVAPQVMYHGARSWFERQTSTGRIALTLFDQTDPAALARALKPGRTELVWIESPVNPTWDVIDIAAAAKAAHGAGAVLAVDSTVATPVFTRPLELGADLVFHSATKYLNGHSDVLAGVLITAADDARWREILSLRTHLGSPISPPQAWLLMRGLRTLHVRVRQASGNALALARQFENDRRLAGVLYPGLASHPGHAIAAKQMIGGFSAMVSIRVKGGFAAAGRVVRRLEVFQPATSLGGVESLAEHRKVVEGPDSPVPDDLIRLSIGIEALDDLIADLDRALG